MNATMSSRDQIRAATVGSVNDFKKEITEYNGVKIELREPTEKQRAAIIERCSKTVIENGESKTKINSIELMIWSMICCSFIPDTNEVVFTAEDYETLMAKPASKLDKIKKEALKVFNYDREELEKNSEPTTDDTTSSN